MKIIKQPNIYIFPTLLCSMNCMIKTKSNGIKCGMIDLYKLFGKKWSYALFYNIDVIPISFNEIDRMSKKKINPTLLSKRLKELVGFKLIKKKILNNRTYYSITKEGKELKSLLKQIKDFCRQIGYELPQECRDTDCENCGVFREVFYKIS